MAISGHQNQDYRTIPNKWPNLHEVVALDMGCGIGLYSDALSRRGGRVVGIDFERENLYIARKNDASGNVRWVCADARHLPFRASVFAVVVSVEVLTHLPIENRRIALLEMARVATGGGSVYLTLHNKRRLDLKAWLVLRSSQVVYETNHLNVWPTYANEAIEMMRDCGMQLDAEPQYLNYYSRFSIEFIDRHPILSRVLVLLEDFCSRLPVLRQTAITFLLQLRRDTH